ncbi:unnamed protein product [Oikopleura dioica]|uniref:Uncharacterized protein n=1 Tax=Oikopleura dioica TaxID=34765 RepID=E4YDP6_OIKDI|nr:unnamed protein product [Oikopleura dioica]
MSRYVKSNKDGVVTTRDCLERAADGRRLIHNGSLGGRSRTNSRHQDVSKAVKTAQKQISVKKISKPRKIAKSSITTTHASKSEVHRNIQRVSRRPVLPEVIVISDSETEDDDVIYVGTF